MKSIVLILPYFGKWPVWFDAFLISVAKNPTIHWFCPTDCELPKEHPDNLRFYPISLSDLNQKVNTVVDCNVPLTPRKFCDLKPAYGAIFKDEIKNYDFWGFCDMDIIWGDIRKFITEEILDNYDIISSRKQAISGHFNLFKNTEELRALYKKLPDYKTLFEHPDFQWTDETVLTNYLKNDRNNHYRIYWDKILCNQERGIDSWQGYYLDKWIWKSGRLYENHKNKFYENEIMYLHFISWKKTMRYCYIRYTSLPNSFYISYKGIKKVAYPWHTKKINDLKNQFYGFWFREKMKLKKKRLMKKINRKINKYFGKNE